jgi:hypothetical protein
VKQTALYIFPVFCLFARAFSATNDQVPLLTNQIVATNMPTVTTPPIAVPIAVTPTITVPQGQAMTIQITNPEALPPGRSSTQTLLALPHVLALSTAPFPTNSLAVTDTNNTVVLPRLSHTNAPILWDGLHPF